MIWLIGLVVVGAAAAWWWRGRAGTPRGAFRRLVKLCGGDEAAARRLVRFERDKDAGLDENQAVSRALKRLQRDRR